MYIPSTFFNKANTSIDYLIVGGGGGTCLAGFGGDSKGVGGGGAGGFVSGSTNILLGNAYYVSIGAGGAAVTFGVPNAGRNSSAFDIIAYGGGFGGYSTNTGDAITGSGGSGGGGWSSYGQSGSALYGSQGNDGGIGISFSGAGGYYTEAGGGGGGATGKGTNGTETFLNRANAGNGGAGKLWLDGNRYAGGGGGGQTSTAATGGDNGGFGGTGGGGTGSNKTGRVATGGTPNTGGGAGGGGTSGGSGIVKIRYTSDKQLFSGGIVETTGSYFYHIFTTSSVLYTYTTASVTPPTPTGSRCSDGYFYFIYSNAGGNYTYTTCEGTSVSTNYTTRFTSSTSPSDLECASGSVSISGIRQIFRSPYDCTFTWTGSTNTQQVTFGTHAFSDNYTLLSYVPSGSTDYTFRLLSSGSTFGPVCVISGSAYMARGADTPFDRLNVITGSLNC